MQPPAYVPRTSFATEEQNAVGGRSTVRTAAVDVEFANLKATLAAILVNLAILQRDDTALQDGIVTMAALDTTTRRLIGAWNPRGLWMTATAYAARDLIENSETTYVCAIAHTSDDFATDEAAGKWIAISRPTAPASGISFSAGTEVTSTDVQAAIEEVAGDVRSSTSTYRYVTFGGF